MNPILLQGRERLDEVRRALIAPRRPLEVPLVVLLCAPPLPRGRDLGDDAALPPLLVGARGDVAGLGLLLGVVVEDGGAVLGPAVRALAVKGGGVVRLVEELEELAVGDLRGVKEDLDSFGVYVITLISYG
jgi:hypothetical protein